MYRQPGRYEYGVTRPDTQWFIDTGTHIEARRTIGRIGRQWDRVPHTRVEDLQFNASHSQLLIFLEEIMDKLGSVSSATVDP